MFRRGMGKSLEIRPSQNVNELEADKLVVTNFTANKLTVNTLVVNSSGIVNVADTLTAGNIQLFASQLTAGTIITDGDIGRDYLDDRIKATTGNLEARNVKGLDITLDITVAKNLIASGDVRVYDRVTVNGDLTAKNVTALRKGITVGGNLVANNVDAQNTNNSADGGKITAGSIDATGNVTAKGNVTVAKNVTGNDASAKTITADSLTLTDTAETQIDGTALGFEDDTSNMLSFNKDDKVTLLKKNTAGMLKYTGTKTLDRTYTSTTNAGQATVQTTGKVAQDGDALNLNIDDVKYTFDLASDVKNGDTFLTSTNTGTTKIDAGDVTLNDSALQGNLLHLSKGDNVYLLQNDTAGTLTYTGTNKLSHEYTTTSDHGGSATVTTTGTVAAQDNDLVLGVDKVKYTFTLNSATKAGEAIVTSANTGRPSWMK